MYNADDRRGVADVADVGLRLQMSPRKGSKGPYERADVGFPTFSGCLPVSHNQKLRKLKSWGEIKRVMHEAREAGLFPKAL